MKSVSLSAVSDSCNHIDCSPPGSSVHGILQAIILEWIAFPSPGHLPGIEPRSPALQVDSSLSEPPGKLWISPRWHLKELQFLWWPFQLLAGDEHYHLRLFASQYKPATYRFIGSFQLFCLFFLGTNFVASFLFLGSSIIFDEYLFSRTFKLSILLFFFFCFLYFVSNQQALSIVSQPAHRSLLSIFNQHQQFVINPQSWQLIHFMYLVCIPVFYRTIHFLSHHLNSACAGALVV